MTDSETVYRIVSAELKAKGEKIEGLDKRRMEKRLAQIRKYEDPAARILAIPLKGR